MYQLKLATLAKYSKRWFAIKLTFGWRNVHCGFWHPGWNLHAALTPVSDQRKSKMADQSAGDFYINNLTLHYI